MTDGPLVIRHTTRSAYVTRITTASPVAELPFAYRLARVDAHALAWLDRMEPILEFSLASHDGPYDQWPDRTPLLRNGQPTGARLQGYVLEAQYRCVHGIVLITSYDCPFEESNDFYLLSDEYTLLAHTQLVVPYGSYLLHAHWPVDAARLRLHYHARLIYTLSIIPPSGMYGSRFAFTLQCEGAMSGDDRARASIAGLEQRAISTPGRDNATWALIERDSTGRATTHAEKRSE